MHSRVTSLEVDTVRTSVDDALELFRRDVLPRLREQPGYEGVIVLATREGRGLLVSFWATEEDASRGTEAEGGFWSEEIACHMTIFRSPPGREEYEVAFAEAPALSRE